MNFEKGYEKAFVESNTSVKIDILIKVANQNNLSKLF